MSLSILLAMAVGLIIGGLIAYIHGQTRIKLLAQERTHLEQSLEQTRTQRAELERQNQLHRDEATQLRTQEAQLTTRLALLEAQYRELQSQSRGLSAELQAQFRVLASEIMQERSAEMLKRNEEALVPLRENLQRFEDQFQKAYADEARERFSLGKAIESLIQRSHEVSRETQSLTNALRGDKTSMQGNWGEMILENILEQSGLRKGHEYIVQKVLHDAEGRTLRPDIIVKYPNGGFIIIDSKVSLTAYLHYTEAETDEERRTAEGDHLASVRRHIKDLAERAYQDALGGSPDFVLLFMPNEPSYNLVMQLAPTLWEEAYTKRVILINGTNLIAALRMAQDMWQRDRQIKNVDKIIAEASALYDQFALVLESLEEVEKRFLQAGDHLQLTRKRLVSGRGNLIGRFQRIQKMGLKNQRSLPKQMLEEALEEDPTEE